MASNGVMGDHFVITVRGAAGRAVQGALGDVDLTVVGDCTRLRMAGSDQAALHGLLHRIRNLGLEVVEFHQEPGDPPGSQRGWETTELHPIDDRSSDRKLTDDD